MTSDQEQEMAIPPELWECIDPNLSGKEKELSVARRLHEANILPDDDIEFPHQIVEFFLNIRSLSPYPTVFGKIVARVTFRSQTKVRKDLKTRLIDPAEKALRLLEKLKQISFYDELLIKSTRDICGKLIEARKCLDELKTRYEDIYLDSQYMYKSLSELIPWLREGQKATILHGFKGLIEEEIRRRKREHLPLTRGPLTLREKKPYPSYKREWELVGKLANHFCGWFQGLEEGDLAQAARQEANRRKGALCSLQAKRAIKKQAVRQRYI